MRSPDDVNHVYGRTAPQFDRCRQALHSNLTEDGEYGAACAVYFQGECVVDIWGGVANFETGAPWTEKTIAPVFSVTKGVASLCVMHLCQQGLIDIDERVSSYWPEFSAHGKGCVTVREMLAHRAGVPIVDGPVTIEDMCDAQLMASRLAAQKPVFEPGSEHLYHTITHGWLVSELVRRATGRTLSAYFREAIAEPLDLDIWIGLPDERRGDVAVVAPRDLCATAKEHLAHDSLAWRAATLNGCIPRELAGPGVGFNDPRLQAAEIAGAGGIASAASLAKLYGATLWKTNGQDRLLSDETIEDAIVPVSTPLSGEVEPSWGAGFMLSFENSPMLGPRSFGHNGAGGNLAFADPDRQVAFAYVKNHMNDGAAERDRTSHAMVAAVENCLSDL